MQDVAVQLLHDRVLLGQAVGSLQGLKAETSKNKESHCTNYPRFTGEKHQESGITSNTDFQNMSTKKGWICVLNFSLPRCRCMSSWPCFGPRKTWIKSDFFLLSKPIFIYYIHSHDVYSTRPTHSLIQEYKACLASSISWKKWICPWFFSGKCQCPPVIFYSSSHNHGNGKWGPGRCV